MKDILSHFAQESLKYLGWILLFAFLWFKGCTGSSPFPQIAKVIVPEAKGVFEAKKPVHEPILINDNKAKKGKTTFVENPIDKKLIAENEKLKSDYAKANDSIKQLSFNRAIQLNKFSSNFENDDIKIDITGVVQGEVKEITPSYTIKEKKVEVLVKQKETVFRLLAGVEVGNNKQLDAFKARANLMFQNRKGNIISGSFDTNQTVWIGYNVLIFDVKK